MQSIYAGQSIVEISSSLHSYLLPSFHFHAKLSVAECVKEGWKNVGVSY